MEQDTAAYVVQLLCILCVDNLPSGVGRSLCGGVHEGPASVVCMTITVLLYRHTAIPLSYRHRLSLAHTQHTHARMHTHSAHTHAHTVPFTFLCIRSDSPSHLRKSDRGESHRKRHREDSSSKGKKARKEPLAKQQERSWLFPNTRVRIIDRTYKQGKHYNEKVSPALLLLHSCCVVGEVGP